ncbi:MAG: hypothetical protein IJ728_01100 [Selenomonadaceae bacterium]|nr:hypothetical protein [Selenomonadaceae bacterium]
MKKVFTVKIMFDYLAKPLWISYYNPETKENLINLMHFDLIDNDEEINKICAEIEDIYSSYYYFDYKDQTCYFDKDQELADKDKMLELLKKLNDRLNEINDGSFVVEDKETDRLKAL